jgi:hypothetical protein
MLGPSRAPSSLFLECVETPARVREQRIAAVDDDIAFLKMRDELCNYVVDGFAGFNQDDHRAGSGERRDKLGNGLGADKTTFRSVISDQFIRPPAMPIVNSDAEALSGGVARKISAHRGKAKHAEIRQVRHRISPFLSIVEPNFAPC